MYALDNNSGVVVMPEVKNQQFQPNAPRWFTEGGNGIAPSYPGADWFNIVQAELLNILTDAGMTPDKGQFNQITQAIRAIVSASVKTSLNDKAPIASPIFTGTPKAPTPAQTVNDTTVATTAYVRAAIAALVGTAPATLDTLSEIANALAEDKNVKATLLAEIGKKANFNHTHTVSQITDFNQATSQIINTAITYQKIGNVEIRKYPDGTMIQTGLVVFTREGTTVHTDLVLPIAYVDKEYRCFITERYESRASGKGQYNWVFMQAKTNTTATVTSWYLGTADWMTIGRWK
ncbi:hypothetical protein MZA63_01000 [Haemophilus influenzae]|nr:hypothetical protein [Haemophilus influenzae]